MCSAMGDLSISPLLQFPHSYFTTVSGNNWRFVGSGCFLLESWGLLDLPCFFLWPHHRMLANHTGLPLPKLMLRTCPCTSVNSCILRGVVKFCEISMVKLWWWSTIGALCYAVALGKQKTRKHLAHASLSLPPIVCNISTIMAAKDSWSFCKQTLSNSPYVTPRLLNSCNICFTVSL